VSTLEAQAAACADRLGPEIKKAEGRYYTPPEVVAAALAHLPLEGTLCDFACGSGHFLVAEARRRLAAGRAVEAVAAALFGRDLDAEAVALCRARLVEVLGPAHAEVIAAQVQVGDGLAPFPQRFDAVAANPPYRAGRLAGLDPALRLHIPTAAYQLDPYALFLDRALRLLVPGGRAALVLPDTWLFNHHSGALRAFVLGSHDLQRLVRLPASAFAAGVEATLALFTAGRPTATHLPVVHFDGTSAGTLLVGADRAAPLALAADERVMALLAAARHWSTPLTAVAEVTRGVNPYHHTLHRPEDIAARIHHAAQPLGPAWRAELRGRHLPGPYQLTWEGDTFIHYGPHLKEPRPPRYFEGPRLLVRKILGATLHAAFTDAPFVCDQSIYIVRLRPGARWPLAAVLGCLNSRLLADLVRARHPTRTALFPQLKVLDLKQFPLPPVAPDHPAVRALAACVEALPADAPPTVEALACIEAQVVAIYGGSAAGGG